MPDPANFAAASMAGAPGQLAPGAAGCCPGIAVEGGGGGRGGGAGAPEPVPVREEVRVRETVNVPA